MDFIYNLAGYIYSIIFCAMDSQLLHCLRGVVADSEDTIKMSADSLGKRGFINYFGLQVLPYLSLCEYICVGFFFLLKMFQFTFSI